MQSLCAGYRGAAPCWGQGAWQVKGGSHYRVKDEVPWRVEGSRPIGSRVKRLAQGELMPASTRTGYYLTQKSAGLAASPLLPLWGKSTEIGGMEIETDTA